MYYVSEDAQRPEGSFLFKGVSGESFAPVALSVFVLTSACCSVLFCVFYDHSMFCGHCRVRWKAAESKKCPIRPNYPKTIYNTEGGVYTNESTGRK